jgi:PKD repeat protein
LFANSPISYSGSYTYDKPIYFWGFPSANLPFPRGFHLDNQTGYISFRPMKIEQTILALQLKEWRKINGVMTVIGKTRRDIQLIVINCPNNYAPTLSRPYYKEVCALDTIRFKITTYDYDTGDTLLISWNNAIPGAIWSDSNNLVKHPSATLTWIPNQQDASSIPYEFLVTVKDNACPKNSSSTQTYQINVKKQSTGDIISTDYGCGNYSFDIGNLTHAAYKYTWTDLNSNKMLSNQKTFSKGYRFPGTYPLQLELVSCNNYYSYDTIIVTDSFLYCELSPDTIICSPDSITVSSNIFNNKGNTRFWWSTGDTTNQSIRVFINSDTKIYFTVEDSTMCQHTDSIEIFIDDISLYLYSVGYKCPESGKDLWVNFYHDKGHSVNYQWFQSPSLMVFDSNRLINVTEPGTYICQAEDNLGCILKDSVEVLNYTVTQADAGSDDTICSEDHLYKLTGSPTNYAHQWTGNGVVNINGDYYFDISKASGQGVAYIAYFTLTDNNTCVTTDSINLIHFYNPKPKAGNYPSRCTNDKLLLLTGIPGGGSWSGPGIENGTYFNPDKVGSGKHKVVYSKITNSCIGYDTTEITVYNFDPNIFELTTAYNRLEFCHEFNLVKLNGIPSGGIWSGSIINGSYFDASALNGENIFKYYYTDSNNCTFYDSIIVNIGDAAVKINPNDTIICTDEKLAVNATYKFANGIRWIKSPFSDGTYIGSITSNYIKYISGTNDKINKGYWLKIKTTDPICKEAWDSVFIDINEVKADFSVDTTSGSAPLSIYFMDESSSHAATVSSWSWEFGDNSSSWDKNPFHSYKDTGYFDVGLRIISSENCSDSILKKDFIHSMQNISIAELDESQIMIYPNPTDKELIIKFVNSNILINSVSLLNLEGKILDRYVANSQSEIHIQAINQPSGFYFLKIEAINGISYYRKITIIK